MSPADQRIQSDRYQIIPRTLAFLCFDDEVLLIKYGASKGSWCGFHNGLGGHIERGEDPLTAIRREILEETGISADNIQLCGTLLIDTVEENPGVGLFIYVGQVTSKDFPELHMSEGELVWLPLTELDTAVLMDDVRILLPAALQAYERMETFSGWSRTSPSGSLEISFAPLPTR